jgi:hypothetical protein
MRRTIPYQRVADDRPPRPITLRAAEKLDAFELARLWSDPNAWFLDERTAHDELAELAVMTALGNWLHDWQPIAIHGAMRAGARPEAVVAALGGDLDGAYERWRDWATRQRDLLYEGGKLGISPEEYDSVEQRFVGAGVAIAVPDCRKQVA